MNKVYAVGVMQVDLTDDPAKFPIRKAERLWFFYANFEDAEKCVLENQTDIFEYYYNIALIEEHYVHDPKDPASPDADIVCAKQWWYLATYKEEDADELEVASNPTITAIDQPKGFEHVVNFWAG
jgi:hypothetical protein